MACRYHVSSLIHHAIHTNIHPDKTLNDWITRLCLAGPHGQFFGALRQEHLDHHRELGAADDPERFYYDLKLHGRTTATGFLTWLTGVFLGWVIIPIVSRWVVGHRGRLAGPADAAIQVEVQQGRKAEVPTREKLIDVLVIPPVQAVLFGLFWLATGQWWGYFAFWALPLVTVSAGLNAVRATVEHANPDEHATAGIRTNAVLVRVESGGTLLRVPAALQLPLRASPVHDRAGTTTRRSSARR